MKIVAAAIKDVSGIIYSLPIPARHHDLINQLPFMKGSEQGFLTSEGTFVTRFQARVIVERYNQPLREPIRGTDLFSENLW